MSLVLFYFIKIVLFFVTSIYFETMKYMRLFGNIFFFFFTSILHMMAA